MEMWVIYFAQVVFFSSKKVNQLYSDTKKYSLTLIQCWGCITVSLPAEPRGLRIMLKGENTLEQQEGRRVKPDGLRQTRQPLHFYFQMFR